MFLDDFSFELDKIEAQYNKDKCLYYDVGKGKAPDGYYDEIKARRDSKIVALKEKHAT